jgi:hypothetical protein
VFHLDVAYVTVAIYAGCKCVFQMYQLLRLDVAWFHLDVAYVTVTIHVCCTYFIWMLLYVIVVIYIYCKIYISIISLR